MSETIYLDTDDLQASEFEADIKCPNCEETDTYYFRDLFFEGVRQECDFCGHVFKVSNPM